MRKYVPVEKRSKKEQRKQYSTQRADWNGVIPVTKVIPNKKKSSRAVNKTRLCDELY